MTNPHNEFRSTIVKVEEVNFEALSEDRGDVNAKEMELAFNCSLVNVAMTVRVH